MNPLPYPVPPFPPNGAAIIPAPAEPEPPTPAVEAAHAKASRAVAELIAVVLLTDDPHKFHDAARIATIGKELMSLSSKRAADFIQDQRRQHRAQYQYQGAIIPAAPIEYGGDDQNFNVNVAGPPMGFGQFGGPLDSNELIRQALLLLGPAQQTTTELNRAQTARAEAEEIESLLRSIKDYGEALGDDNPSIVEMKKRIEALKNNMEVRNGTKNNVVRPELPRGHQAGVEGVGGDARHGLRPHAAGGGRHEVAAGGGHQEQVGEGERLPPPHEQRVPHVRADGDHAQDGDLVG